MYEHTSQILDVPYNIKQLQFLLKHILLCHSKAHVFNDACNSPVPTIFNSLNQNNLLPKILIHSNITLT
jgi:hypothetical protein